GRVPADRARLGARPAPQGAENRSRLKGPAAWELGAVTVLQIPAHLARLAGTRSLCHSAADLQASSPAGFRRQYRPRRRTRPGRFGLRALPIAPRWEGSNRCRWWMAPRSP